ncbi:MAG: prolipoprotein diacylglyceryl transferase [Anaerolineae bacterium]|nr:prolipoprotein diacylglyceryl transferase [Anaerolineae bacterium]
MSPIIDFGLFSLPAYPALHALAILAGFAALIWKGRASRSFLPWVDAGLGGLIFGLAGGRLAHVLLNAAYFRHHPAEAFALRAGGLDWHGALIGALVGLLLVARWRRVPLRPALEALALVWPLGLLLGWAACRMAACGYGAEVWTLADFPGWAAGELPDLYGEIVPRYNTQVFGMALGAALLGLMALAAWRGWLRGARRLGLVLALSGPGMFAIGFFRGDGQPGPLPGLSWDQALDLGVIALGVALGVTEALAGRMASHRATERNRR